MKNYIIYTVDNKKVKRKAINLNEIYPLSAVNIPDNADQIAKIITSKNNKCLRSSWYKHSLVTNYNSLDDFEINQTIYKNKWANQMTKQELEILNK